MLEQVENGTITNLGKLSTVESYLNNIQELGVNPITLSDDMNISEITATAVDNSQEIQITLLVNLIDILKANYKQTLHDEQYGETLTEEDLKRIDEL